MNNYYQPYGTPQMFQRIEVIKVHGEEGAKAYQLPPNSSVLLLDETAPVVWLKTTDGASYPTTIGYKIEPLAKQQVFNDVNYKSLEDRISNLERLISNEKSYAGSSQRQQQPKQ